MKRDLSQEIDIKILKKSQAVSASTAIATEVVDIMDYSDIAVYMSADITAGNIAIKVECASNKDFDADVEDITDKAVKQIVNGKEATINKDRTSAVIGIAKELTERRFIKVSFIPDAQAAVTTGLDAVMVLDRRYAPAND